MISHKQSTPGRLSLPKRSPALHSGTSARLNTAVDTRVNVLLNCNEVECESLRVNTVESQGSCTHVLHDPSFPSPLLHSVPEHALRGL